MRSKKDMFLYFLNDVYSIELATLSLTKDLANKARDENEKRDLNEHVRETKRQINRLKSIISRYGGSINTIKAATFSFLSIGANVFQWAQTNINQERLRMLYDGLRIENMEIGVYKALIAMAKDLEDHRAVVELTMSLEEEIAMSRRTEKQLADVLGKVA